MSNSYSQELPPTVGLNNGDNMSQADFHKIYETMPANFRAELIGGIVYVSMPLKRAHGTNHSRLTTLLDTYKAFTPGIELCDNTTVILGDDDEVQPDLLLRIMPPYGGQSKNSYDGYVQGAPELVAEVASSSRAIDLHLKLDRYAACGVLEYVVVCLWPQKIYWFDLQKSSKVSKAPDENGIFKSSYFPGLWIHGEALLSMDYHKSMEILNQGIASSEHAAFVDKLKRNKR